MPKVKNPKHSTIKKPAAKSVFDEYINMRTFMKVPVNSEIIERMCIELCNSVDNPEIIRVSQLCHKYGLHDEDLVRLREKYPQLEVAYQYILIRISENRELGAAKNRLNANVINSTQAHYCRIAKAQAQWRSKLKEQQAAASGIVTVEIPAIESSPLVPNRKDKKEKNG